MKNHKLKKITKKITQLKQLWRSFCKQYFTPSLGAYAGQSAYMMILSFFPFAMFLVALLKYTPISAEYLISATKLIFPSAFHDYFSSLIMSLYSGHGISLLSITVFSALWLGSKSFFALINGLNSVYHIETVAQGMKIRIWSIIYTILFAIFIIATLISLVFGNRLVSLLLRYFPFLSHLISSLVSLRSLACIVGMLLCFTLIYQLVPNNMELLVEEAEESKPLRYKRKRRFHWRQQLPGAIVSTLGWMIFSFFYSVYVDHFTHYSSFYGAMTTIALLMVWLYACMYIVFLGGMINYLMITNSLSDIFNKVKKIIWE